MTEEDSSLIDKLEEKVRHLMFLYDKAREENRNLKEQLNNRTQVLQKLQQDYETLDTDYMNLKRARIISVNNEDVQDTKQKLSKLVREVNKCLALLNSGV